MRFRGGAGAGAGAGDIRINLRRSASSLWQYFAYVTEACLREAKNLQHQSTNDSISQPTTAPASSEEITFIVLHSILCSHEDKKCIQIISFNDSNKSTTFLWVARCQLHVLFFIIIYYSRVDCYDTNTTVINGEHLFSEYQAVKVIAKLRNSVHTHIAHSTQQPVLFCVLSVRST